jgi:hypothetical protein
MRSVALAVVFFALGCGTSPSGEASDAGASSAPKESPAGKGSDGSRRYRVMWAAVEPLEAGHVLLVIDAWQSGARWAARRSVRAR